MKNPSPRRWLAEWCTPSVRGLFDIQTHLTDREKLALFQIARNASKDRAQPISIVEVGAYLGASSAFLAAGLAGGRGQVLCIDTWNNDTMSEGGRDTMREFVANTMRFAAVIHPVRGWSTDAEVVDEVARRAGEIDVLFIDGDHSYDGAIADWNTYAPLLAPDAIVAMHDIGWADGVQRVVADYIRPRVVRERRLPNLWWGQLGK
jgi:predicted O-methyltransferase YrrM